MSYGGRGGKSFDEELRYAYLLDELERRAEVERAHEASIVADGAAARAAGLSVYTNPHTHGSKAFDHWRRGYYRRALGGKK